MENGETKFCEICKDSPKYICFDCGFYLCDSCFKFIHEKKANLEHKKEVLNTLIPMNIKCQEHPKNPMNLFCVTEKSK